jgi:hypothetical protein
MQALPVPSFFSRRSVPTVIKYSGSQGCPTGQYTPKNRPGQAKRPKLPNEARAAAFDFEWSKPSISLHIQTPLMIKEQNYSAVSG